MAHGHGIEKLRKRTRRFACTAGTSVIDMDCGLRQALHFKGLHLTQSLHAFTPHWLHSQGSLA